MNDINKSKEELLKELEYLRNDYESLKKIYEHDKNHLIKSDVLCYRKSAEELLIKNPKTTSLKFSESENLKLIHELEVHQIELEMRNEELIQAKIAAQLASQKYHELYEFAPSGFFTLSNVGKIIELNLCAAQMLGKERSYLINSIFASYVTDDTKALFYDFLENMFKFKDKVFCEVTLLNEFNLPVYVYLTGRFTEHGEHCLVTAVDISVHIQADLLKKENEELKFAKEKVEISDKYFKAFTKELNKAKKQVEITNDQLSALLQTIPDIILIQNRDGDFIDYHAHQSVSLYSSPDVFIGKNMKDILPLEIAIEYKSIIEKAVETNIVQTFEYSLPMPDGIRYFESRLIAYEKNKILSIIRDITERKHAEEEIRQAKEQFELFFNTVPEAIVITRMADGRIVNINSGFTSFIGYTKDEIIGKTSFDINIYKNYDDRKILGNELLTKGYCFNFETVIRLKNGSFRTVIMFAAFFNMGGVPHILNIAHDITERKITEEKLRESEFKFRTIADYSYDWEYWEAEDKSIIYMNPSCERMSGYLPNDFITDPELLKSIVHKDDLKLYTEHCEKIHSKEYCDFSEVIVFRVVNRDHSIAYIEHICIPVLDENEHYYGRRISNRDITERKWAEDELIKAKELKEIILKNELTEKENQLINYAKSLQERDDYLYKVKNMLDQGKALTNNNNNIITNIGKNIELQLQNKSDWLQLEQEFIRINPLFMNKLSTKYPRLTNTEVRVCAMIKLNLRSKEIADILNISQKTIDNHRLKIRKKLNLNEHTQLSVFLMNY
jgi:PAS domain S-box-containing protein